MTAQKTPFPYAVLAGARIPHWVPPHTCKLGPAWEETTRQDRSALAVSYVNGFFVVCNRAQAGGGHAGTLSVSSDGRNYTETSELPVGNTFSPRQILFGNGIYLVNSDSSIATAQSTDLFTGWVLGSGNPNVIKATDYGAWFGGGLFVICAGLLSEVFASANASNQITHATPAVFNTGIYDELRSRHVACVKNSNDIYTSPDLVTWTQRGSTPFTGGSSLRLVYGNGVLATIDPLIQRNTVALSSDGGDTWHNSSPVPVTFPCFFSDLIYVASQDMWLLIDNNAFVYRSNDGGETWAQTASSLNPILGDNTNWKFAGAPDGFLYIAVPITIGTSPVAAVGVC